VGGDLLDYRPVEKGHFELYLALKLPVAGDS
jgi:hypothetical protein